MIETVKGPESATEVLVERMVGGAWAYRITVVNGILRLEMAQNTHDKATRQWMMCAPEGQHVFDALLTGLTKMHKRTCAAERQTVKISRALIRAVNALEDESFKTQVLEGLPGIAEIVRAA